MAYEVGVWPDVPKEAVALRTVRGWERVGSCGWDDADVTAHDWSYRYDFPAVFMVCDVCGAWIAFSAEVA